MKICWMLSTGTEQQYYTLKGDSCVGMFGMSYFLVLRPLHCADVDIELVAS